MKYASFICLLSLLLLANTCRNSTLESKLIGTTWLHAFEEDKEDVMVYRPNTYDFAPSRGRTGFTLEKNGVLKQYDIAPTDGLEEHTGEWTKIDNDKLLIEIKENSQSAQKYIIEVVSVNNDVLKLKKIPAEEL